MTYQESKEFIEQAVQNLRERGWISEGDLTPSSITEEEIKAFEKKHQITLPSLYRAFLTSYCFTDRDIELCSIAYHLDEISPLWLLLWNYRSMEELEERIEILQEIQDFCELPENSFQYLVPIGDWGAGFGPLCIDLSRPEEQADEENEQTWSLVWFDHEDFDWDEQYLGEDGLLHGREAAPGLKVLLEWYFYGSLEDRFEREEGTRLSYEWYQETLKR